MQPISNSYNSLVDNNTFTTAIIMKFKVPGVCL